MIRLVVTVTHCPTGGRARVLATHRVGTHEQHLLGPQCAIEWRLDDLDAKASGLRRADVFVRAEIEEA